METIPELTAERLEWQRRLSNEWPVAEPLLRRTGRVAEHVWCPSPGGDDCPRQVVHHDDGRIVAVCGDRPKRCDPLPLSADDITVFAIDWRKLAAALARVFEVDTATAESIRPDVYRLGEHLVASGNGLAVVLWVPQPLGTALSAPLEMLPDASTPAVLLVPTRHALSADLADALKHHGHIGVVLLETVGADDSGALTGLRPAADTFAAVRDRLIRQRKIKAPEHRFPTPLGTEWQHVSIRFISGHDVHIRARAESAAYNFAQMGMANAKKKPAEPNVQWQLLVDFAENGGELTWRNSMADRRNQKRKELLAKALKTFFGIDQEPFDTLPNGLGWRARFTITPEA